MKLFFAIFILFLLNNCSFDNKTGIWNDEGVKRAEKVPNKTLKKFKSINTSNNNLLKEILPDKNLKFILNPPIKNLEWTDVYYDKSNNFDHFSYSDQKTLVTKSRKISRYELSPKILFEENTLFLTDIKGNLIIYSIDKNSILRFNFYKKKYKKIKKKLNFIIENNIIYISDNLGYVYAFDYYKNSLQWAKYYKIPFRSNLKIYQNKLITSDQNNNLYFIDKFNGDIIKLLPTEETLVKKSFRNNISINNKSFLFLNTYGSLYSIDNKTLKMNWFLNLNRSINLGLSNLFSGNEIVNHKDKIYISSNDSTYIIDSFNGKIISKKNFSSYIKPILYNNIYISVTKNNFLVTMDSTNGELIYYINLNEKILNIFKEPDIKARNVFIANNKLHIFLNNSYVLNFDINGNFLDKIKLPAKILSDPIFVNNAMLFVDKKRKLIVVN